MATRLYLDTARLGLMTLSAQHAHRDFARLAGEEGLSLYWDRFLSGGFSSLPSILQDRCRGLATWRGISELKSAFRRLVGLAEDAPVVLSGRSTQAMRLGMRLLFSKSRRVMTTDLTWPAYRRLLRREARRANADVVCTPLRRRLLRDRIATNELSDEICHEFRAKNCDGIFLPAVSHDGIGLPIQQSLARIRGQGPLRFSLIDGAQHFCHGTDLDAVHAADFYVTGAHKWLGASLPLGLAVMPMANVPSSLAVEARQLITSRQIDDPIISFTCGKGAHWRNRYSETVNLVPLLTCRAAMHDQNSDFTSQITRFEERRRAILRLAETAVRWGWRPMAPDKSLQTGILVLKSCSRTAQSLPAECLRRHFADRGIAVSTYSAGRVRIASPPQPCSMHDLSILEDAFRWCPVHPRDRTDHAVGGA